METSNKEIKRRSAFSLLFYINRARIRRDGTYKLLCKVSIDAKSAPININAFVGPSSWNLETRRVNGRSKNVRTANLAIEKLTEKITGHYRHTHKSLGFMTAELVKNTVERIGQEPFILLTLLREHNEKFRRRAGVDHKEEIYESYESPYNILAPFVKRREGEEDVALRSFDREFYDDSEIFLRTDREMEPKAVHEHLYRLKKMIKQAISQGALRRDSYGELCPELPRRKSRHLKLEDLRKLAEIPVGKLNLQRVRDRFLFATFTGLSYADLKRLSEKDIMQSDNEMYWVHIRRQKTEAPSVIHLPNVPLQIVERYRHECKSDGVFNLYCRGYFTKLTRGLGRTYGFDMTFHKAGHNFGTCITFSLSVPIETVSHMTGHKSISITQIYAKAIDRKVDEDMKRLKEQTKGRKVNLYGEDEPEAANIIVVNG